MATSAFGRLVVNLGLETTEFKDGLTRAEYLTAQFSTAAAAKIGAVGALAADAARSAVSAVGGAIRAIPDLISATVDQLDKVDESAKRFGTSVEFIQSFGYALKFAGVGAEEGEKGISKFQQALTRARATGSEQSKLFAALGLDAKKFGADTEAAFEAVVDKLAELPEATRNTFGRDLFGKAGAGIADAFSEGSSAIKNARAELEAFGALASGDVAAQAAAYKDNIDRLTVAKTSFGLAITTAVLPTLGALTAEFVNSKKGPSQLRDEIVGLTAQGTPLLDFAQSSIELIAKFGDVMVLGAKGVATIADAARLAINDLRTFGLVLFEVAKIGGNILTAPFSELPDAIARNVQQIKTLVAERNAVLARGNLDLANRFSEGSGSVVSDLVARTITPILDGARRRLREGDFALPRVPRRDDQGAIDRAFGQAKPAPSDNLEDEIRGLERQREQLRFSVDEFERYKGKADAAKAAGIDFDLAIGKFADAARAERGLGPISADALQRIRDARDGILDYGQELERLKALDKIDDRIKVIDIETDAVRKTNAEREKAVALEQLIKSGVELNSEAYRQREAALGEALQRRERARGFFEAERFAQGLSDQVEQIRVETRLLGENELAVRAVTEARRIDLAVRDATRQPDGSLKVDPAVAEAYRLAGEAAKGAFRDADRAQLEFRRSAAFGAQEFARNYIESATDAAKQAESILSTTARSLEDQIIKVFRDGKFEVRAFFETIAEEALRLTTRDLIGQVFKGIGLDRAAGGSGAVNAGTSLLSGLFGSGGGGRDIRKDPNFDPSLAYSSSAASSPDNTGQQIGLVATALRAIVGLFGGTFATGGDLTPGKWGIVGENGPEIALAPAGGMQIIPMGAGPGSRVGGSTTNLTVNFDTKGHPVDKRAAQNAAAEMYRTLQLASRRNN